MYFISIFCLVVIIIISIYTFQTMSHIKKLVTYLEGFCNNVVIPQLSLYETEYTEKEKIFDRRINMLKDELSNLPPTNPAEILDPAIYNIIEDDDYMTIIEGEEVAD